MSKYIRTFALLAALVFLLMIPLMMQGCATFKTPNSFVLDRGDSTEFQLKSHKISVKLPEFLSAKKLGTVRGENCFNTVLCVVNYNYNVSKRNQYEHVLFWIYCGEKDCRVIGLIWVLRTGHWKTAKGGQRIAYKAWLYKKTIPKVSTDQEIQDILNMIMMGHFPKHES